jgi:hypothetical protein
MGPVGRSLHCLVRRFRVARWVTRDFRRKQQRVKPAWSQRNMIGQALSRLQAGLQKVSAQLEVSKPGRQTVLNNQ